MISPELASFLSIALIIIGSVATAFVCLRWESGLTIESFIGSLAIAGICVGLVFGAAALGGIEAHGWWILPLVAVVTFIAKEFLKPTIFDHRPTAPPARDRQLTRKEH